MKKTLFIALLAFAMNAKAQTYVSGGIYSNATWTKVNSPYIVTDTIVVFPGVTLTIQPGVVVKFDTNIRLEIRQATLIAQGTISDSITFTANTATPSKSFWCGIYLNSCSNTSKFVYCNIKYSRSGIYNGNIFTIKHSNFQYNWQCIDINFPYSIDSCNFSNNNYGVYGSRTNINNCNFINNLGCGVVNDDTLFITKCNFLSNSTGVLCNGSYYTKIDSSNFKNNIIAVNNYAFMMGLNGPLYVNNCDITNNQKGVIDNVQIPCACDEITNSIIDSNNVYGINIGGGTVSNCEINNNGIGLRGFYLYTVAYNDIKNNNIGILVKTKYDSIYCNKICNNIGYDLYDSIVGGSNINAANNYWCTNDSATVETYIYDGYDNINLSLVKFMPIDTIACYLITGMTETTNSSINNISIYPNPATNNITIETRDLQNMNYDLSIIDIVGNTVLEKTLYNKVSTIDVSTLAKGMYFIKIKTVRGVESRKFVKL